MRKDNKLKNGHVRKLPSGEAMLVLTEGDVEVCINYLPTEEEAEQILKEWKEGKYRLLNE